jgi:hypothetical protein
MKLLLFLVLAAATMVFGADTPKSTFDQATGVDPVFASGLVTVKQVTGFTNSLPSESPSDWLPYLQLLIGVEAVEGTERTIYFIELTTLPLPTNVVTSRLSQPPLVTNTLSWGSVETNKSAPGAGATYVSKLYPVQVRVFDERGRQRGEGGASLPWGLLPNGLGELCRLSVETSDAASRRGEERSPTGGIPFEQNDELRRSVGGTLLWLTKALEQVQTVPAVKEVWGKALCACRTPGMVPLARSFFSGKSAFGLDFELREISRAGAHTEGSSPGEYVLPVHLTCGSAELTRIDVTVAPPRGAGMILAGIRSVHAAHPTKPQQEFTAQVLAVGMACPGLK